MSSASGLPLRRARQALAEVIAKSPVVMAPSTSSSSPAPRNEAASDNIREKSLESQQAVAAKGNHDGRPKVIDDDMLVFARAQKDQRTPIPQVATKLTTTIGKNAGHHPSVASLYRALGAEE